MAWSPSSLPGCRTGPLHTKEAEQVKYFKRQRKYSLQRVKQRASRYGGIIALCLVFGYREFHSAPVKLPSHVHNAVNRLSLLLNFSE